MSRHNAKVPTVFYESFARDAAVFADKYGQGRVLAVLEGGYSQKALMTGIGSFSEYTSVNGVRHTDICIQCGAGCRQTRL